jgi:hypothetical protein
MFRRASVSVAYAALQLTLGGLYNNNITDTALNELPLARIGRLMSSI